MLVGFDEVVCWFWFKGVKKVVECCKVGDCCWVFIERGRDFMGERLLYGVLSFMCMRML